MSDLEVLEPRPKTAVVSNMPPTPMTVKQRLIMIASEMQPIAKDRSGNAGGGENYKFRGIDDVIDAAHPAFVKWGVLPVYRDASVEWEDVIRGNNKTWRHYLVTVEWTFYGWDGDDIKTVNTGEGLDNADKGLGKARSYALKDLLTRLLTLPTNDPLADNEANTIPDADAPDRGVVAADAAAIAAGFTSAQDRRERHDQLQAFVLANIPEDRREELRQMRGGQWPVGVATLTKVHNRAIEIAAEVSAAPAETDPGWDGAHDEAVTATDTPSADEIAAALDEDLSYLDADALAALDKPGLVEACRVRGLAVSGPMLDLRHRIKEYQDDIPADD